MLMMNALSMTHLGLVYVFFENIISDLLVCPTKTMLLRRILVLVSVS